MTPRDRPIVATNGDGGPHARNERGVDILDGGGGMVYLQDADLPHVISLLAQHLSGVAVSLLAQVDVAALVDSDERDDALALVEEQLATLHARRAALVAQREHWEAQVHDAPVVTLVPLHTLLGLPAPPPARAREERDADSGDGTTA